MDDDNTTANHKTIADDEITGVANENGNTEDDGITPTQSGNNQNDDITGGSPNQATNNNTEIARVCEMGNNGKTNQTSDLATENQTSNTEQAFQGKSTLPWATSKKYMNNNISTDNRAIVMELDATNRHDMQAETDDMAETTEYNNKNNTHRYTL